MCRHGQALRTSDPAVVGRRMKPDSLRRLEIEPMFRRETPKNHTLSSGTSPYRSYGGLPPPPRDLKHGQTRAERLPKARRQVYKEIFLVYNGFRIACFWCKFNAQCWRHLMKSYFWRHVGGLFTNSSQTKSPRSTSKIAEKKAITLFTGLGRWITHISSRRHVTDLLLLFCKLNSSCIKSRQGPHSAK